MIGIKDMEEIPESCWDCPILCKENGQCERTKKYIYGNDIPSDCPLTEIVTCKDCKHRRGEMCRNYRHIINDDFFCADAERRE